MWASRELLAVNSFWQKLHWNSLILMWTFCMCFLRLWPQTLMNSFLMFMDTGRKNKWYITQVTFMRFESLMNAAFVTFRTMNCYKFLPTNIALKVSADHEQIWCVYPTFLSFLNDFSHLWHWKSLIFSWTKLMCFRRLSLRSKALPQVSQMWFFIFSWTPLMCPIRVLCCPNSLLQ